MRKSGFLILLLILFSSSFTALSSVESQIDSVIYRRVMKMKKVFPMTLNEDVQQYISKMVYQNRENTQLILSQAQVFFPILESELAKHELPEDFKWLPLALSGMDELYISESGGVGLWQLQYFSALRFGLNVNENFDERRVPVLSTKAAIKMIEAYYTQFKDWGLTVLAFISSPADVKAAIKKSNSNAFWDVFNYIPFKDQQAYYRIIASAYLDNYFNEYDFKKIKSTPLELASVEVKNKAISLSKLAADLDVSKDQLMRWNPMFRSDYIPGNIIYQMHLPAALISRFNAYKEDIVNINVAPPDNHHSNDVVTEEKSDLPNQGNSITTIEQRSYYKVVSGDNLGKIAQKYNVTVSEIKKWNKLKSDKIVIGQKLTIIKNKQVKSEITSVNTDEKTLLNNQDNSTQNNTEPETNKDKNIEKPEWVIYKVKSGDTVWKISQKYNVSSSSIISLNNIKNNNIYPGQTLKIKKK